MPELAVDRKEEIKITTTEFGFWLSDIRSFDLLGGLDRSIVFTASAKKHKIIYTISTFPKPLRCYQ